MEKIDLEENSIYIECGACSLGEFCKKRDEEKIWIFEK
jgi:hypothetical protein